jgi:hypothetical protein
MVLFHTTSSGTIKTPSRVPPKAASVSILFIIDASTNLDASKVS